MTVVYGTNLTALQTELSVYYGYLIVKVIRDWQLEGMTYRQMSRKIYADTGYAVKPKTLQRWMSYWRNGR